MSFDGNGRAAGAGAGTEIVDVAEADVEDPTACTFFSLRVEYIAAVTAAPVVALTAAMMAIVVLDILKETRAQEIYYRGL
jgi:hypothetical protein